jgi:hypothetical protein
MQLTLLFCASLIAAAPLPPIGWKKAALITGGVGATALGTYEIAHYITKKNEEKKAKEMEDKMMLEALISSMNPSSTGASESSTGASSATASSEASPAAKASTDSTKEVHPFISLKETPPFPDKNPMAGN